MRVRSTVLTGFSILLLASISGHAADVAVKAKSAPAPEWASLITFSDTTIGYRFEPSATNPGTANTKKNVFNISHFNTWLYGDNFVSLDWLYSDKNDPANCLSTTGSCANPLGSTQFYGIWRGGLSGNAVTGSKSFSIGFIKDVSLSYGVNWDLTNTAFASEERAILGGVKFAFDVPGSLTFAIHAYQEWGHNGLPGTVTSSVQYNTTAEFEISYYRLFELAGLSLKASGYTNIVLPKGPNGFGLQTTTEVLSHNRLTLDLGKMLKLKPNQYDVYIAHNYWRNKFGLPDNIVPFSKENAVVVGFNWHVL